MNQEKRLNIKNKNKQKYIIKICIRNDGLY